MVDKIAVENCINKIKNKFEKYPDIFLTEEDVRGNLFCCLSNCFGSVKKAKYGYKSVMTHSQVSWYNNQNQLRKNPDISIIDVRTLDMKNIASKGFRVKKIPFVIELKLNRGGKNKEGVRRGLIYDLNKMEGLQKSNKNSKFYMLYLDKRGLLDENYIRKLQSKYSAKIIYVKCKQKKILERYNRKRSNKK